MTNNDTDRPFTVEVPEGSTINYPNGATVTLRRERLAAKVTWTYDNPQPSLKDRLTLVNAGDTLTVVDTRADVWTGVVRAGEEGRALRYGTAKGAALRFAYTHNPGESVADVRDHVPAVKTTPEPTNVGTVIRDASGRLAVKWAGDASFKSDWISLDRFGSDDYANFTQPVTVLFEGVDA